jgi:hypothetical protein
MDLERVTQCVLCSRLQELVFRDESGVYVLGNSHTAPARWYVGYQPPGLVTWNCVEGRGLQAVLRVIEQMYPTFYAWLTQVSQGAEMGTAVALE